ncbi:hypothetical protein Vretimale_14694 [Volvox reticuliferus]|uniref:Helitron helicase-like domain-containing protein n=2 Tax=Volvox reticuliferus TaxID=1737510 RepID=A0A8J4GP87_9CHLO|nr:hypothetical protein Vretimale_14694 [Volvox reticuliferus]
MIVAALVAAAFISSGRKRSLNPPEQACLRRQRCDSEQDLEIGSEDGLEEGLVSHQAAANNINPLQQHAPPQPPNSPPITLPTPDASTFQAMMTSMLTSPMFLQQIAMAMQQLPQAQTTFVPPTQIPEASAVHQASPSPAPQPTPPPNPTAVNAPTDEQSYAMGANMFSRMRLRRQTSPSWLLVVLGIVALVALFGVTIAGATRQGRKRSLNPPEQACLRRQRCDSEQDLEIGSEDGLEEGLVSHQAAANNINPLQQHAPPQPPNSPPITLPTPDASTFQAMMTSMLTSPMFLQQIAMAMQQLPQAQTTFVPPTQIPEASAVHQASPSPAPQPTPPPNPTAVNAPTDEQSEWQWACACTDCDISTYIETKKQLELHMANVFKYAMMCPLCSCVYLGDKVLDKKWLFNHTKWYTLNANETIESLPGVRDCPHNRSWVQEKNGGTSVKICNKCHIAKTKVSDTNPRWNWLSFAKAPTQIVTFLRRWLPRQPFEVGRLFCIRLDWVCENLLKVQPGHMNPVFGEMTWYSVKIEFQGRGSAHAHFALMLADAQAVDRVNHEIIATTPDATRYPELHANPQRKMFWNQVAGLIPQCHMIHQCSNTTCKRHGTSCSKGFPRMCTPTPTLDPVLNRWEYMRLHTSDSYIVNYHPGLLFILGCHVHLQRGTDATWLNYLMKYQWKVDTHGSINIKASNLHAFGLPAEVSVGTLQSIAASLHAKVVSVNEAAWVLQDNDLARVSDNLKFVNINLDPPNLRSFVVNHGRHVADAYFDRPKDVHPEIDMATLVDWKTKYEIKPKNSNTQHPSFICALPNESCLFRRSSPLAPILRTLSPKDGEKFYYSEIMQSYAVRSHDEAFKREENLTKSWCEAAYLHGLFTDDQSLREHVRKPKYSWEGNMRDSALDFIDSEKPITTMLEIRNSIQNGNNKQQDDTYTTMKNSSTDNLSKHFMACIQRQYAPTVDQQVAQCLISQCEVDPDQHNILAILEQNMHKLWRIQGAGGHGKSHTLRAFIAKATSMGKINNPKVLLLPLLLASLVFFSYF